MSGEFRQFLKEYGIVGLAIAVVVGGKVNTLVSALVDGVLMPVLTFFVPEGGWRSATLDVGPVKLLLGPVVGAGIDFLIVAWIVFWLSKRYLGDLKPLKK